MDENKEPTVTVRWREFDVEQVRRWGLSALKDIHDRLSMCGYVGEIESRIAEGYRLGYQRGYTNALKDRESE